MNEDEVVSYRYDPYGAVTITVGGTPQSSDPLGNPWMYTGRFHDEESGLEYYRARYYSTGIGRFLQRDPLGTAAGSNLYAYVGNDPTGLVDPFGLAERTGRERNHKPHVKEVSREPKIGRNRVQWKIGDVCYEAEILAMWDEVEYEHTESYEAEVTWEDHYWQRVGETIEEVAGTIHGVGWTTEGAKMVGGRLGSAALKISSKVTGWTIVISGVGWLTGRAMRYWASVTRTGWQEDKRFLGYRTEIENFRVMYAAPPEIKPCRDEGFLVGKNEHVFLLPELSEKGRGGGCNGPRQPGSGWRWRDRKKKVR